MSEDELKPQVTAALRHFKQTGLRWSYIINGTLVIVGFVANYFLPHGWVVWPAVLAIGMLVMINEAVDRNGQGWPPLLIYASVAAVLTLWVLFAFIFSAIAPVLLFVGVPALAVFGVITWLKEAKRRKLVEERRANGRCVHCGEPVDVAFGSCGECGREVDQEDTLMTRIRSRLSTRSQEQVQRARDVLTPAPPTVAAQRKERELLARKAASKSRSTTKPVVKNNPGV